MTGPDRVAGDASSEIRGVAKATGVVGGLTLLSRVTGLARDIVISYLFGAGFAAEAFFVAFRFPTLLRRLAAEGATAAAFVPVFSRYAVVESRRDATRALNAVLGACVVLFTCVVVVGVLLAPLWVTLFAPGFSATPDLHQLTVRLSRLVFPYIGLIGITALLGGFLNAYGHFVAPALSPAVMNLSMIGCALALAPLLPSPIYAVAGGLLFGGCLQVATQIVGLRRIGVTVTPVWQPRHAAVGDIRRRLAPTLFGQGIMQINVLVATILASFLPLGSISYLWYANRLFEFPLGLVATALGTATLPALARQSARGAFREVRGGLTLALAVVTYVAVPAAVGLFLLAEPITSLLFGRGEFGANDTAQTAAALRCFALGLWAVAAKRIISTTLFALGDTKTPVLSSLVSLVVNLLASIALMGPVAAEPGVLGAEMVRGMQSTLATWGAAWNLSHRGLALATAIGATVSLIPGAVVLRRRLGGLGGTRVAVAALRSAVAAAAMALVVRGVFDLIGPATSFLGQLTSLLGLITVGIATFAAVAMVLGGPELDQLRSIVRNRANEEPGARS